MSVCAHRPDETTGLAACSAVGGCVCRVEVEDEAKEAEA